MPRKFSGLGIEFLYPDNWLLSEESSDKSQTSGVTLESPVGAFLSINRYPQTTDIEGMVTAAQTAMEQEYQEIETEDFELTVSDRVLVGTSQSFYYLDLLITSKIMAFVYEQDLFMIQIQGEDRDLERLDEVFRAVLVSLMQSLASSNTQS